MADQTIDSLTADIGLTTEEFEAGVNRVLGAMEKMRVEAASTGEGMTASLGSIGSSIGGLALRFTGLFLAVRGLEDVVGYFKDLSVEFGNLGFESKYLGQSGVELSRWGEVARLAGGNAQDAVSAVQSLQQAIFGLEFQGQIGQNLLMLQRLGVGYLNTAGQMRPLKDIAMETAAALQRQLPGQANQAMRVQWAAQIFGPGGLANAVGGGLTELRKFYSESAKDQKSITQKVIDSQMHLQQSITHLSYDVKSHAAVMLNRLTPTIEHLIGTIENKLIPTIDELIGDVMDFLHPTKMLEDASNGPMGLKHPINDLAHLGSWLGGKAADFRDWWQKHMEDFRADKLDQMRVPSTVLARLAPGTNLEALKLLHMQAGGDDDDPTWSKAVNAYRGVLAMPGGAAAFVSSALSTGVLPPSPGAHGLSTPSATRPAPAPSAKPTASLSGPRVQIGTIGPIYTQATDAAGLMADVNRAAQRKILAGQSDPGLA